MSSGYMLLVTRDKINTRKINVYKTHIELKGLKMFLRIPEEYPTQRTLCGPHLECIPSGCRPQQLNRRIELTPKFLGKWTSVVCRASAFPHSPPWQSVGLDFAVQAAYTASVTGTVRGKNLYSQALYESYEETESTLHNNVCIDVRWPLMWHAVIYNLCMKLYSLIPRLSPLGTTLVTVLIT